VSAEKLAEAEGAPGGLMKKFKLETTISTSNMHLFATDRNEIVKFNTVDEIFAAFYDIRLNTYRRRKEHLVKKLTYDFEKTQNRVSFDANYPPPSVDHICMQMRFIREVISGTLVVSNRKKKDLMAELKQRDYKAFPKNQSASNNDSQDAEVDLKEVRQITVIMSWDE
jgi:DNA topoisomerase-2